MHSMIHQLEIKGILSQIKELALWKHSAFIFYMELLFKSEQYNQTTWLHKGQPIKYAFQILSINIRYKST